MCLNTRSCPLNQPGVGRDETCPRAFVSVATNIYILQLSGPHSEQVEADRLRGGLHALELRDEGFVKRVGIDIDLVHPRRGGHSRGDTAERDVS